MPIPPTIRGRLANLRIGRVSEDFACYSISKAVNYRSRVLSTDSTARILMDSWQFLRSRDRIKLFAFCIMPEHYHLVFCLMPGEDLSKLIEESNRFTARELNIQLERSGKFWQEGFHDHRCRNDQELHDLCLYVNTIQSAKDW